MDCEEENDIFARIIIRVYNNHVVSGTFVYRGKIVVVHKVTVNDYTITTDHF